MKKASLAVAACLALLAPLAAQSVRVTSPNGGESWPLKNSRTITWTCQNAVGVKVNIVLRNAAGVVGTLKRQVDLAAGSWTWDPVGSLENGITVPPAAGYSIRIRDADNTFRDDSDMPFTLAATAPIQMRPLTERLPPVVNLLKLPRLEVTAIRLTRNAGGYGITFGYKNVGGAALPRRSELTVKPDYRVLIDGREVDKGDLFIPQSPPAGPGWELETHSGGFIDFPASTPRSWHIGTQITIHLNERNALNMGTASKTSSLLPMALPVGYDLAFLGQPAIDWNTNKVSVVVTKAGSSPQLSKRFDLTCTVGYYHTNTVSGGPGQGTVTYPEGAYTREISRSIASTGSFPWRLELPLEPSPYYDLQFAVWPECRDEFDERNNFLPSVRHQRPGTPPGPRVTAMTFSTRRESDGSVKLRTLVMVANETPSGRSGLRLLLKRNGSKAEEWRDISLAAGQKQMYIHYGSNKGPSPYNCFIHFEALLYDGGGNRVDSRSADHCGDY